MRRHLYAAEIRNYKPAQKITLTPAHREERVRFAQEYLNGKDLCWNMVRGMRSRLQQVIAGDY